eukprot:5945925-Prymnesium_polylepis.1
MHRSVYYAALRRLLIDESQTHARTGFGFAFGAFERGSTWDRRLRPRRRLRFDFGMRVTAPPGEPRKEGSKHIKHNRT